MRVNTLEGKVLIDIEAHRVDEEFENWMMTQGFGDNQLDEANEMLDNMIKAQESILKKSNKK